MPGNFIGWNYSIKKTILRLLRYHLTQRRRPDSPKRSGSIIQQNILKHQQWILWLFLVNLHSRFSPSWGTFYFRNVTLHGNKMYQSLDRLVHPSGQCNITALTAGRAGSSGYTTHYRISLMCTIYQSLSNRSFFFTESRGTTVGSTGYL